MAVNRLVTNVNQDAARLGLGGAAPKSNAPAGRTYRAIDEKSPRGTRQEPLPEPTEIEKAQYELDRRELEEPQAKHSSNFIGDVFMGATEGVTDMVGGMVNMVIHPIQTVKGLVMMPLTLLTHPAELIHAFTEPYTIAMATGHPGRAIGRGLVEVGSLFFGSEILGGAGKMGGAASKGAEVAGTAGKAAEVATTAGKAAEVATTAGKAAEVATTAGKAAEVASSAGKAAKVVSSAGKASKAAEAAKVARAAKAARAARITKAAKAAKAARSAEVAGHVAESASQHVRIIIRTSQETAGQAARAAKAEKAARAAAAARKAAEAAKAERVARFTRAAEANPQVILRESRAVRMSRSLQHIEIPGKGTLRIQRMHYESIRELKFVAGGPVAEAGADAARAASKASRAGSTAGRVAGKARTAATRTPVRAVRVPAHAIGTATTEGSSFFSHFRAQFGQAGGYANGRFWMLTKTFFSDLGSATMNLFGGAFKGLDSFFKGWSIPRA